MAVQVPYDAVLGRWRLTLDLFARVFCDDVACEPGSVISELGGFPVKETRFRREMERLRNSQQKDLSLDVERDRDALLTQTFKQLNTHYNRRTSSAGAPLLVHRVKVQFKEEPGEGSGVARSFYTAFAQAVTSSEKLPNLDGIIAGGLLQKLRAREKYKRDLRTSMRMRESRRPLSYESPAFYPSDGSAAPPADASGSGSGARGGSSVLVVNDLHSNQRRQLGDRLYPKVAAIQPVRKITTHAV